MKSSKLKLNVDKNLSNYYGYKTTTKKDNVDYFPIKILGNDTSPSDTVRNLGVVIGSNFSSHYYISQIC